MTPQPSGYAQESFSGQEDASGDGYLRTRPCLGGMEIKKGLGKTAGADEEGIHV